MKSEFYVVNLVRSSEEARQRVAECLGLNASLKSESVVFELSQRNVLWRFMTRYECNWRDVFAELRRVLDRELDGPGAPEEGDLCLLLETKGQRMLGELLECVPSESLQLLFSSEDLEKILRDTGIARQRDWLQKESEWLLSVLLSESSRGRLENALGSVDLWELLYDLMRDSTRSKLAEALGSSESDALRVFVRRIKQTERPMKPVGGATEFGSATSLDTVALSKFRVFLHLFRYSLMQEAKSQAHRAKARLPGCRLPALLPSLIEYYVSGDFRSALNDLMRTKEALRKICSSQVMSSMEQARRETRIEVIPVLREGDETAAGIWCVEDSGEKRTEIVRLRKLDAKLLEHIQNHIPNTVGDLPQTGSTVADRILNSMFPPYSAWKRSLRAALASATDSESVDDVFVQALVLSGASLRSSGADGLDFGPAPNILAKPEERVEFRAGAEDIARELREEYRGRGRTLKTIRIQSSEATQA